jgi:UDP-glucose 4-epimerase
MATLCGREIPFVQADVRDAAALQEVFRRWTFDAVVHFAGLKSVNESVLHPLRYYDNNVVGTVRLVEAMMAAGVKRIVFSSSATVYGVPDRLPIPESAPLDPVNPYGQSKLIVERLLADVARADPNWRVALLRYFNPVGAHESGLIGEAPGGVPNNLMPIVSRVAVGILPELRVFGTDYDTPDGTGVRDYIHVMDLASGHAAALERILEPQFPVTLALNLGTGRGYSVLEVVRAFESASGRHIRLRMESRRAGDVASCYADPARAFEVLGWKAGRSLAAMCEDAWRWQRGNPGGYD